MTDTVTEAAVEAAWAAMREAMQGECLQELAIGVCDNPVRCQCRVEVRAALEAALPLLVAGERWQPIETAPKDGTDVLLWTSEGCVIGYFATVKEFPTSKERFNDWTTGPASVGSGYDCGFARLYRVTHWMPRPEPPAAIRADKGGE